MPAPILCKKNVLIFIANVYKFRPLIHVSNRGAEFSNDYNNHEYVFVTQSDVWFHLRLNLPLTGLGVSLSAGTDEISPRSIPRYCHGYCAFPNATVRFRFFLICENFVCASQFCGVCTHIHNAGTCRSRLRGTRRRHSWGGRCMYSTAWTMTHCRGASLALSPTKSATASRRAACASCECM